ncbi:cob(I)yrinic acid a,c-diamide adenosyltransferase [uncultured Bartonella sp.]|uniref:cob(I)yrinic acid a,c-diamide adenosyltransferase n=1 Tax=uncultured Bartonella sp. TaxID=104108 RepID=UPI0026136672|nr:cob(I)yrinic acid a,c-diamide adenosyltransferase [uncultured Bartonella sp.]
MVKLNKIYTRTGDDGTTGLVNGERRSKADLRVEAYGTIDETNAAIGLARLETVGELDKMLEIIQNDLFDLGADLATPQPSKNKVDLRIVSTQTKRLENEIDKLNKMLSPLTSFVLPGGSKASAHLHLARTVVRRAERAMVALHNQEKVNNEALQYINRLSDFLFVAARYANDYGKNDVLWTPGKNR